MTPVAPLVSKSLPTASVAPSCESDTLCPNRALGRVFEAFTYDVCVQLPAFFSNTKTAPADAADVSPEAVPLTYKELQRIDLSA